MKTYFFALLISIPCISGQSAQKCEQALDTPPNYPNDDSGVRAQGSPPVFVGGIILMTCPQTKEYQGTNSWTVTCTEQLTYRKDFNQWPICQCDGGIKSDTCSKFSYETNYADDASMSHIINQVLHMFYYYRFKDFERNFMKIG